MAKAKEAPAPQDDPAYQAQVYVDPKFHEGTPEEKQARVDADIAADLAGKPRPK